MKNTMKKMAAAILAMAMTLSCLSVSGFAAEVQADTDITTLELDTGESVAVQTDEYDELVSVSAEVAAEFAKLYVADMQNLDDVNWDEDTQVVDVIPMYDSADTDTVTAYTVELTEGYVVVSAYLDTETQFLEWSDSADALCEDLNVSNGEKVVYTGGYGYYTDDGTSDVTDLYGATVERDVLENDVLATRDASNLTPQATEMVVESTLETDVVYEGEGVSTTSDDGTDDNETIVDPYKYANYYYTGTFSSSSDYINEWENYMHFGDTNTYGDGVESGNCGPTAITNMILSYKNRYPSLITTSTAADVYEGVVNYGIYKGYYTPLCKCCSTSCKNCTCGECTTDGNGNRNCSYLTCGCIGTLLSTSATYIKEMFAQYAIQVSTTTTQDLSYNNIKYFLGKDHALLHLGVSAYGDTTTEEWHSVVGYAYVRMYSSTTGWPLTFIKVCDGWCGSGRYISLSKNTSSDWVMDGIFFD